MYIERIMKITKTYIKIFTFLVNCDKIMCNNILTKMIYNDNNIYYL